MKNPYLQEATEIIRKQQGPRARSGCAASSCWR